MKNVILSSSECRKFRPKHCALTKFLRHHSLKRVHDLEKIIEKCEVNPHVGCLPPELRILVARSDLSNITNKFFDFLDFFVVDKNHDLTIRKKRKYDLKDLGALFNTTCVLETYETISKLNLSVRYRNWAQNNGFLRWEDAKDKTDICRMWAGAVGDIYKLSFPKLGVSYALKVFKNNLMPTVGHGAFYEVPVALNANKSEPKQNNPVYMANLLGTQYMLSKWVDVNRDNQYIPELREHAIYKTSDDENEARNYCNGKRIDFGKTRKTYYGNASYPVRKLYRQMEYMNPEQLQRLESKAKNNFEKINLQQAKDIIYFEYVNQKSER